MRVGFTDELGRRILRAARSAIEHDRQRVAERRAGPSAFGERPRSAERQQAAAADVHEVLEHPLLVGRERRRFHGAENDRRGT